MKIEKKLTFYKLDNGLRFATKMSGDNKVQLLAMPSKVVVREVNIDKYNELVDYMLGIESKVKVEKREN
ncbi:hypothetical protein UT300012_32710 [Paraclostridium bifermentans]